jgi:branched-chain amino acid transport system permease protein
MLGLHPYRFKLAAFVLSGGLASVAGVVYLLLAGGATPRAVGADLTVALLLMVIIGGAGSLWGPIAGAVLYHYLNVRLTVWAGSDLVGGLPAVLREPLRDPLFIFGLIFVGLVLFFPRGLAGALAAGRLGQLRRALGGTRTAAAREGGVE